MSARAFPPVDLAEMSQRISTLILETDIEAQLANIRDWLGPYFPLKALGLSLSEDGAAERRVYAIDIEEDLVRKLEEQRAQHDANRPDQANESAFLFSVNGGAPQIGESVGSEGLFDIDGLGMRLTNQDAVFGALFLAADKEVVNSFSSDPNRLRWFGSMFSSFLYNTVAHHQNSAKMRFFNLYETVSLSLCYAGDLQELLTTIIGIVVSELPSEGGSILLFDEETNELEFFSVMGDAEDTLYQRRFPADKGIAGQALQDGVPVVVNDVQTCPYFFGDFDSKSGFVTRSILAAPIVAGEEKVGVIEAINKVGKDRFDETDKRVLIAIADEVGLAIKNARMFDYVVDSYCKIRQGQMSCKGCVRPLKTWTPCARQLNKLL